MSLKAGKLKIRLEFQGSRLSRIDLPAGVPVGLSKNDLVEAFERLSIHELAMENATPFQAEVWRCLRQIPCGQVRSYGAVAEALGRPKAARAVGAACGANPFLLLIPCHRVIGAHGIGGYRAGLAWKRALLRLEAGA